MTLETKRLLLRPWEESDAESCYRSVSYTHLTLPTKLEV